LCDNLSSYISVEVVELCREANVEFVCLPPNITDKLKPMKRARRQQPQNYSDENPAVKLLMNSAFPGMLKELFSSLSTGSNYPRHLKNVAFTLSTGPRCWSPSSTASM
jgi:hypothetical protein